MVLPHVLGRRVLEIGFGTGDLLVEMAERDYQLFGLDPSRAMHRVATSKMRRRGVYVPCVRARAQEMPFSDGSFETIIATFPGEYILSTATLLEVSRLLRCPDRAGDTPGGRFVVLGLAVKTDIGILRRTAQFFYGRPAEDPTAAYERLAKASHFAVKVVTQEAEGFKLPILILERDRTADTPGSHSGDVDGYDKQTPIDPVMAVCV